MGTLFKKKGSKQWQMGVMIGGRQLCRSAHTTNKGIATKLLARWETEILEGRFQLIKRNAPFFEDWSESAGIPYFWLYHLRHTFCFQTERGWRVRSVCCADDRTLKYKYRPHVCESESTNTSVMRYASWSR